MNLVAYDNVDSITNNKRSWIDVHHKTLYTREVKYHKYVCFGKNFNPDENRTVFYIILLDDEPTDRASFRTIVTTNGCIKIDLRGIWVDAGLSNVTSKYLNATLKCTADSDDGNVYEFVLPANR